MKPIFFSRHAIDRILDLRITKEDIIKAITEGEIKREGKIKFKAIKRTKKGLIIALCAGYCDHIRVITVMKRR